MRERPPIPRLALTFLVLGAQAFGGQAVTVALLERDLVRRRGWLRDADITEALTWASILPGSTNVGMVSYLGQRMRGLAGALTATTAFLLPSFLVMLAFAVSFHSLVSFHGVPEALRGLTAAVVGLVGSAALRLGQKTVRGWYGWIVALLTFVLSVRFHVNPALLVVLSGLWGVARGVVRRRRA